MLEKDTAAMTPSASSNAQHAVRTSSADRVRVSRARQKRQERVVPLEVRNSEITALVAHGFLSEDRKDDPRAIAEALGRLLDQMPPRHWPMVQGLLTAVPCAGD
jgi:hypothetical protein